MKTPKRLIALFLLSFAACASLSFVSIEANARGIRGELTLNGTHDLQLEAGKAAEFRFRFTDTASGKLITKFKKLHQRSMHLVILRSDLSTIAHVHPIQFGDTGEFVIFLNQKLFDPDNFQSPNAISKSGEYYLYAEIFPDRGNVYPVAEIASLTVTASSDKTTDNTTLAADAVSSNGEIVKYFGQNQEPSNWGAAYRVSLKPAVVPGCDGNLIHFDFELKKWNPEIEFYEIVYSYNKWLGMAGHALMVSDVGGTPEAKSFVHMHSMKNVTTHLLRYSIHDRKEVPKGLQKIWIQVKPGDEVLTFPFVIDYSAEYLPPAGCPSQLN